MDGSLSILNIYRGEEINRYMYNSLRVREIGKSKRECYIERVIWSFTYRRDGSKK